MVENHAGSNDLLDTTDCLEAVGVFKGWKNLLFLILVVCLLLLQAGFFLVDQGYVKINGQAYADEPGTEPVRSAEPTEPIGSDIWIISHPKSAYYFLSKGIVSGYYTTSNDQAFRMVASADFGLGSSGGPVLNETADKKTGIGLA